MSRTATGLLLATLMAVICGCGPHSSSKTSQAAPSTTVDTRPVGATGVPIDPEKKTVLVISAPGQVSQSPEHRLAVLQTQHARTQEQITKSINSYAKNLENSKSKEKIGQQMDRDLEIYKRQSLELYRTQQLAERQSTGSVQ